MVAYNRQRLILPLAPAIGGGLGLATASFFAVVPMALVGRFAMVSGIAAVVPAAEPPLGITARLVLLLGGGVGVAALSWLAAYLVVGPRTVAINRRRRDLPARADAVPVLRRADAHPDAPARQPLFAARDLGTPFLDVRAEPEDEPEVRIDLDARLADYDPDAMRQVPAEPVRALAPLARPQVIDPGDRIETFDLALPTPAAPVPAAAAPIPRERAAEATIHALLDRLEAGVVRRDHRPPAPPAPVPVLPNERLVDALGTLRRLAGTA